MGFSEKQEALVKESWEVMKEDIAALSLYLYTMILEIAPEAKELFSFLKDTNEIPQNNPKLKFLEEMKDAWREAYDQLADAIKTEMKQEAAALHV
ncbi:hypothetical protein E3N88_03110 [Mikania micrantha]|uniref:Globin domain-containing protein n=1 Tax=Mikania micrantha TaxID=192012 RepID=A0A5N6Q5K3_9ASTR|nr:hypothetical protein E3N88_03110 [Mikania micrantha]